ncbi:MAG: NAD(+)/NADH kinase, partial [Thermoplasmata archaeon]|nr:NAD(+)/NADH kinase [Thermoplasmata archaeon]
KAAAIAIQTFAGNMESLADAEIVDADEELLRNGELAMSLFGIVKTPFDQANIQSAKSPSSPDEREFAEAIAKSLAEEIKSKPDMVYILGPGTVKTALMKELGLETSFLGIDAVQKRGLIGLDLNENKLLDILNKYPKASIVITPIGAQGFVLGRGNQQISEKIIKKAGPDNIIIVATPQKLAATPRLLIHTGDKDLDERLSGFRKILNGYRNWEMRKVEST